MPRLPTDYSKALIYKIVCNDIKIKECYYGSTTSFVKRKYCHKSSCNNSNSKQYNYPKYSFIRENGGWDNWNMVLVKEFACNNKLELEREERLCMEQDENRLNAQLPARTDDERIENMRVYYQNNKEKIKDKQKQYRIDNADKIKERQKQHYLKNKEKKKEYNKQKYLKNKNKI